MRKDLRYGMGIGALLLAFIVTFLVVRKHTENQNASQTASSQGDEASDGSVEGGPTEANPAGPVAAGDSAVSNAAAALPPLGPVAIAAVEPANTRTPASDDPFAARRPNRATGNEARPAAAKSPPGNQDWDRILSEGWPAGSANAGRTPALTRTPAVGQSPTRPGTVVPPTSVPTPHRTASAGSQGGVESAAQLRPVTMVGSMTAANAPSSVGHVGGTVADAGNAVAARTGRPYTIREGDTFVSVAKAAFGNGKYFLQIERANPAVNPSRLKVGQQIVLPDLSVEARATKGGPFETDADNRPINARTEYRVDTGDSLYRISMKVYGTPRMFGPIYEANRAAIGPNPERLRFGMILKLPQPLAAK